MEHGHLDGMEYFLSASYGHGLLYADAGDSVLIFHSFKGQKVSISLESVADSMTRGSISRHNQKHLADLWSGFASRNKEKPQHPQRNSIHPVEVRPDTSDLYRKIEIHIQLLLNPEMEDIPLFLQEVGAECLGVEWAITVQRRIRQLHPSGISNRPSKRGRILSEIEKSITNAMEEWWSNIDSHPSVLILANIGEIPEQQVNHVIVKMVTLPYSCHADFSGSLWDFYERCFSRLLACLKKIPTESIGPSVLAYAGWLACRSGIENRRRLVELLPLLTNETPNEFSPLIEFLRFIVVAMPLLAGRTRFDELTETDVYLAACYYSDHTITRRISNWQLSEIRKELDERIYKRFLVEGMQPRIAELAFGTIYSRLHNGRRLADLNADFAMSMNDLKPTKNLPPADWKDASGVLIDVKCNLYFRSRADHCGLRGFMIKRPESLDVSYFGIVFHQTSDDDCSWLGVGTYSRACAEELELSQAGSGERVIPFLFALPEKFRFNVDLTDEEYQCVMALLTDQRMRHAWALAAGRQPCVPTAASQPMKRFMELLSLKPQIPLEFRLWRALTEAALEGCSKQQFDDVKGMLDDAVALLRDEFLPVRLAQIDGTSLIERWIDSVLRPIACHFHEISCPGCGSGDFSLKLKRITSGGAIYGTMKCNGDCHDVHDRITILTHCHKCNAYPIILGKSEVCRKCFGLICDHTRNGEPCRACKSGCADLSDGR